MSGPGRRSSVGAVHAGRAAAAWVKCGPGGAPGGRVQSALSEGRLRPGCAGRQARLAVEWGVSRRAAGAGEGGKGVIGRAVDGRRHGPPGKRGSVTGRRPGRGPPWARAAGQRDPAPGDRAAARAAPGLVSGVT
jgi:hypothetical protein